ncbi:glycosyltransferase involved in cell wall biosynthesis [Planomicrobium soli]|uniref:Glycosyltransferase involved in cell wall biosynthesis n=1 Tax=Planomicrobium soli TaxID=1176648 RepID=A0A2P8H3C9_9BACL|nr:glycosyltransferase [Planomicrobium soli]PSL40700.1 glycosyltransferase involved in cell wall biosynthesis [Planomicrobium soli]
MSSLISIIIPVYNVELYFKKCIESIINQTYKNLEIILINDGSTDDSGLLCNYYAEKDKRIKVIHKKNGGQSSARNAGLDIASGSYIGFIDSDDYIEADMYELLHSKIIASDSDIAICNSWKVRNDLNTKWPSLTMKECILDSKEAMKLTLEGKYLVVSPCNKLYKSHIFNKLRFEEGKIFEDFSIIPEIFLRSNQIIYTPEFKYFYNIRNDSTMGNVYKKPSIDIIKASKHVIDHLKADYEEIYLSTLWFCIKRVWKWIGIIYSTKKVKENKIFVKEARTFIKTYILDLLKSRKMNFNEKIGVITFLYWDIACQLLYKLKGNKV